MGLGRLGGMLAGYGHALDMNVIAWSTNLTEERAAECQVELVGKEPRISLFLDWDLRGKGQWESFLV